jgi:hypothetical protein
MTMLYGPFIRGLGMASSAGRVSFGGDAGLMQAMVVRS